MFRQPRGVLVVALGLSVAVNGWLFFMWRGEKKDHARSLRVHRQPPVSAPVSAALAEGLTKMPDAEGELATLRTQLESLGLPPEIVRAAVLAMMHRVFREKGETLVAPVTEYWRNPHRRPDGNTEAAQRDLQREWNKVKRAFVGDDFFEHDPHALARKFGNLPPEKVARLREILADYSDLENELYVGGVARDSAESRALARERRADIERLLTPEELFGYDLRNSAASERLRNRFGYFAATEAEFLALYPTFRAVTEDPANPGSNAQWSHLTAREIGGVIETEMRRVLGEARFAELKDVNDDTLHETRKFIAKLGLPADKAAAVVTAQKEFSAKLTAIERNRDLTPNERDVLAATLGGETQNRLRDLIGVDDLEAYKRGAGSWLTAALNRRPSPSRSSP